MSVSVSVAVIGGGYGGITVAKALDEMADVTLVERRDAFVHNVASLRALVDPGWTDRIFLPYDRLLARGRVRRGRAVRVDGGSVELDSGEILAPDHTILATGSTYPFPAKTDRDDSGAARIRIRAAHKAVAEAEDVLVLGAGPVGLELAGEILAAWPEKRVTIVDPADDILSGAFSGDLRAELRRQLDGLGVKLLLGTSLEREPVSAPGEPGPFSVATRSGQTLAADVWFRCYGVAAVADYLAGDLVEARLPTGEVRVTPELRIVGHERVFAIGDMVALPEAKLARAAGQQARVVAVNVEKLIRGEQDLVTYTPAPPGISIPLGPRGGASYTQDGGLRDAETTSKLKGMDLRMSSYISLFGLE
jgi:NADH dehydrogenase FAD-containing subunit